jgi:hypothetical protein
MRNILIGLMALITLTAGSNTVQQNLETYLKTRPISRYDSNESIDERNVRLEVLAQAIATEAGGNRLLAAELAIQAVAESGLRRDVAECRCPTIQCDEGKALGYWQLHRVKSDPADVRDLWCGVGPDQVAATARRAAVRFRGASVEEGFRSQGGDRAPIDAPWVVRRARAARNLAGKL